MTSLRKLEISHHDPADDEPCSDIESDSGEDDCIATTPQVLTNEVFKNTRGLTNLTSLVIDGDECLGRRSLEKFLGWEEFTYYWFLL